jgi:hypothetical protein
MTITAARTDNISGGNYLIVWTSLLSADATGSGIEIPGAADKTAHLIANTAGGATCAIEGSNDNTNWTTLHQADGTAASATATAIFCIIENPRYIRAKLTTVGAGADWTVNLLARTT